MKIKTRTKNNLEKIRKEQNLTQVELAEKASVSANYYAKIERGEINMTVDTLRKITEALGVKSSDVIAF